MNHCPRPTLRSYVQRLCASVYFLSVAISLGQHPDDVEDAKLISLGDEWRYFDLGSRPDGWNARGFDDSGWASGSAPLGYGEAEIATVLNRQAGNSNFVTSYFRKTIMLSPGDAPERYLELTGRLRRDDGAVLYLNGTEFFRTNMSDGGILHTTLAATPAVGTGETSFFEFAIPPGLLQRGDNVLAVELHQNTSSSSDLFLDLELETERYLNEQVLSHCDAGGIRYFLVGNRNIAGARVLRLEVETGVWLNPILPDESSGRVTGIGRDGDWLYLAASDAGIRRLNLTSGGDAQQVIDGPIGHTLRVFVHGDYLVRVGGDRIESFRIATGESLSVVSRELRYDGSSAIPDIVFDGLGRIFSQVAQQDRRYLSAFQLEPDGQLTVQFSARVTIPNSDASTGGTWLSPDGESVYSSSGEAFTWGDDPFRNLVDLNQPVDSLTFLQSGARQVPVGLRDGRVAAIAPNGADSGVPIVLGTRAVTLASRSAGVIAIAGWLESWGARELPSEQIALGDLTLPPAPGVGDFEGARLATLRPFIDNAGLVNLFADEARAILRWSPETRSYADPIPVDGVVTGIAYLPESDEIFLSAANGQLTYLDAARQLHTFADLPDGGTSISDVLSAGEYLIVLSDESTTAYDRDGNLTGNLGGALRWLQPSSQAGEYLGETESSARRIVLGADGSLTQLGSINLPIGGFIDPLGDYLITIDGSVIHLTSSVELQDLPFIPGHPVVAGVAFGPGGIATSRNFSGNSAFGSGPTVMVQVSTRFGLTYRGRVELPGTHLWSLPLSDDQFLVITSVGGHPRLNVVGSTAELLWASGAPPTAPIEFRVSGVSHTGVPFSWTDRSDNETGFVLERRREASGWEYLTTFPADTEHGVQEGVPTENINYYRLRAMNAFGLSDSSLSGQHRPLPADSTGYTNISVRQRYPYSMTFVWDDSFLLEGATLSLLRSPDASPSENQFTRYAPLPGTTRIAVTGLTPGTTYSFKYIVTAGAISRETSWFQETTAALPASPPADQFNPADIDLIDTATVRITLRGGAEDADEYIIRRRQPGGEFEELARIPFDQLVYEDENVIPGLTYEYQVVASNPFGENRPFTSIRAIPGNAQDYSGHWAIDQAGVMHFSFRLPARIERFDISSGEWLDPWAYFLPPSQLLAHGDAMFGLFGSELKRLLPDGSAGETLWDSGTATTKKLLSLGSWLAVWVNREIKIIDPADGRLLSTFDIGAATSVMADPARRRLLLSGTGGDGYNAVEFSPAGIAVGEHTFLPDDYPDLIGHSSLVALPGGNGVALASGPRLTGGEVLEYSGSFGGPLSQVVAWGSHSLAVNGDEIRLLTAGDLHESGTFPLASPAAAVAASGTLAFAFTPDFTSERGMAALALEAHDFAPRQPQPLDISGLEFGCDQLLSDSAGTVYCLDAENAAVFRWSSVDRRALPPVPLFDTPSYIMVNADGSRLFVQYPGGLITRIDLSEADPTQEILFNGLPDRRGAAQLILLGDEHLLQWPVVFAADGTATSILPSDSDRVSQENSIWQPAQRTLISFSSRELTSLSFGQDGVLADYSERRLQSVSASSAGRINFSPDGRHLLTTDGRVIDYIDDALTATTASTAQFWIDAGTILAYTYLEEADNRFELRTAPAFGIATTRNHAGPLFRTLLAGENLVAVFYDPDEPIAPRFRILDPTSLANLHDSLPRPAPPQELRIVTRRSDRISISWTPLPFREQIVEVREVGETRWREVARATNLSAQTISALEPGTLYELRVSTANADLVSAGTALLAATLNGNEPAGAPYALRIDRMFATNLSLAWDDSADNEEGFRVYRASGIAADFTTSELLATAPAGASGLAAFAATPSTPYTFWIQAFNAAGDADLSMPLSLQTLATDASPPGIGPLDLQLVSEGGGSVTLRWTDLTPNEDGFYIYRSTIVGSRGIRIGSVGYNTTQYTDPAVNGATNYYYSIAAYNAQGEVLQSSPGLRVQTTASGGTYSGLHFRSLDVLYFAIESPHRIERYDLAADEWLAPLQLPGPATSLFVAGQDAFVSTPSQLVAFLNGGEPQTREFAGAAPNQVFARHGTVFARIGATTYQKYPTTLHLDLGTQTVPAPLTHFFRESKDDMNGLLALSQAAGVSRLVSVEGIIPDPLSFKLGPAIQRIAPGATLFRFPGGERLVTSDGLIFATRSLTAVEHWPGLEAPIDDLVFNGDAPIALHGNEIVAYSYLLKPKARRTLGHLPAKLAARASDLLIFYPDNSNSHGLDIDSLSYDSLAGPRPGEALDISDIDFGDRPLVTTDGDGAVHLFSTVHAAEFTFDTQSAQWLGTRLANLPSAISRNPGTGEIIRAYFDGSINNSITPTLTPITGITAVGLRFVAGSAGPLALRSPGGQTLVATADDIAAPASIISGIGNRRAYLRAGSRIVSWKIVGDFFSDRRQSAISLAGSPAAHDVNLGLLLTTGQLLDADTLAPINYFGSGDSIGAAIDGGLVRLLSPTDHGTCVESRTEDGTLQALVGLPGTPAWIGTTPTGISVVTMLGAQAQVFGIDAAHSVTGLAISAPSPLDPLVLTYDDRTLAIDLARVFAKGKPWEIFNYSDLQITSGGALIAATSIDLESDTLIITPTSNAIGAVSISLRASNGVGAATGAINIEFLAPPQVTALSAAALNPQTGLYEQRVRVSNQSGRQLDQFSLDISPLPPGIEVYNRSGSAGEGRASIWFASAIGGGANVELTIEYLSDDQTPPPAMMFAATVAHSIQLSPGEPPGQGFAIDQVVSLPDGSLLIEFPSLPDTEYLIEYSPDGKNWLGCPLHVRAAGSRVQWIDDGAPKTIGSPSDLSSRLYRVSSRPGN